MGGTESKEFIFLLVKNKKGNIILKRKLNRYERFLQVLEGLDLESKGYLVMGYNTHFRN
jgi:hypothetical protein